MKHACILAISLATSLALLAWPGSLTGTRAGEARAETYSGETGRAKVHRYRRPLEVAIYSRRRRGGYSFGPGDVVNTWGRSPPPYAHVRQSPGGPFDSGFFFDSALGLHAGNAPYQH